MFAKLARQGYSSCRKFFKEREKARDFYLGLVLLVFALTLFFWLIPSYVSSPPAQSYLKVRPTTFPNLITYMLALLAVLLMYNSPRSSKDTTRIEDKQFSWFMILCLSILFVYYLGVCIIGMLPASIIVLFALMRLYGFKNWFLSILLSLVLPFFLFIFFEKLAQVSIPRGILFEGWY